MQLPRDQLINVLKTVWSKDQKFAVNLYLYACERCEHWVDVDEEDQRSTNRFRAMDFEKDPKFWANWAVKKGDLAS